MPEQAEGADADAVLAAEELEEPVVLGALAQLQVAHGRAELVVAEGGAVAVRPQVLGAEGRGAGQAGLHGRRLAAAVTDHGGLLRPAPPHLPIPILILLLFLALGPGAALELLHHPAQHRVLLQLRAAREGGPALRAAEAPREPGPGELQAGGAEVVPAGHRHGAAEEAEADGAGELLLQPRQARLRLQRRHRPVCSCPKNPKQTWARRNETMAGAFRKITCPIPAPTGGAAAGGRTLRRPPMWEPDSPGMRGALPCRTGPPGRGRDPGGPGRGLRAGSGLRHPAVPGGLGVGSGAVGARCRPRCPPRSRPGPAQGNPAQPSAVRPGLRQGVIPNPPEHRPSGSELRVTWMLEILQTNWV